MVMVQRAEGNSTAHFVFVGILQSLTKGSECFFSTCSFGLVERTTNNSTRCVHRIHTRSVQEQNILFTRTNHICACGSRVQRRKIERHHCAMKMVPSSGPPCHLFAGLFHIFSLPVHHNTKHNLDSTTFSKTTLYTERLFQILYS